MNCLLSSPHRIEAEGCLFWILASMYVSTGIIVAHPLRVPTLWDVLPQCGSMHWPAGAAHLIASRRSCLTCGHIPMISASCQQALIQVARAGCQLLKCSTRLLLLVTGHVAPFLIRNIC